MTTKQFLITLILFCRQITAVKWNTGTPSSQNLVNLWMGVDFLNTNLLMLHRVKLTALLKYHYDFLLPCLLIVWVTICQWRTWIPADHIQSWHLRWCWVNTSVRPPVQRSWTLWSDQSACRVQRTIHAAMSQNAADRDYRSVWKHQLDVRCMP